MIHHSHPPPLTAVLPEARAPSPPQTPGVVTCPGEGSTGGACAEVSCRHFEKSVYHSWKLDTGSTVVQVNRLDQPKLLRMQAMHVKRVSKC